MLKAIFGSKALLGAASAGVLAVGGGAVALSGNASEPVQPAKIEQASMQLAEVDMERSYSYDEAKALSENGVILYYGPDIVEADDVATDISGRTSVFASAISGNDEPTSIRLLVLGEDRGTYDQSGLDRGRLGADAIKYLKQANPGRLSALTAEP